jgi:hypothetical protein
MRRTKSEDTSSTSSSTWQDTTFVASYPALSEFLGDPTFADGTKRNTGTLLLFCDGRLLKCCLTDREQNLIAFLSGESWGEMLDAIERGLVEGNLDWRVRKEYTSKKGK